MRTYAVTRRAWPSRPTPQSAKESSMLQRFQ